MQVGSDNDWAYIAAGRWHSVAIKLDGSLWAWGRNVDGQLGIGSLQNQTIPIRVGTANDWATAVAGVWHTLALKVDGTLWAWGSNVAGQLGLDQMQRVGSGTTIWGPPQ
jgi:alpha-tubulin suppressor-like RCC1 family protein